MAWEVGDLALCVDDGPCCCGGCWGIPLGLRASRVYTVRGVFQRDWLALDVGLPPAPLHEGSAVDAARFVKITPDADSFDEPMREPVKEVA